MIGESCMGCGKAAAEKYHRVNLICPGLKLCAGCADALTAAANPASTGMDAICGIQPAMTDVERERLYRIEMFAGVVESLNLCRDCGRVAAMLSVAMQSDNAAILARRMVASALWG